MERETQQLNLLQPHEALESFYRERGIAEDDLDEKYRVMRENVVIPNYPRGQEPTLSELEIQWLIDNDYGI